MTTASSYEVGFHRGTVWAERDLRDGNATDSYADSIRAAAVSLLHSVPRSQAGRRYIAEELGQARGYRWHVEEFERRRIRRLQLVPADDSGYSLSDPKHPRHYSVHADLWDNRAGK